MRYLVQNGLILLVKSRNPLINDLTKDFEVLLVLELNPRGQVAPQVHVSTATPPIGPRGEGGAAVATWGECNDLGKVAWKWSASPTEFGSSSRFWVIFFLKIGMNSVQNWSKKCAGKSWTNTHAHQQTESGRSRASPGPCSGQLKARYRSQMPQKAVPKTVLESS